MASINRVFVFIDFWNFELSCTKFAQQGDDYPNGYRLDWKTIGPNLARYANKVVNDNTRTASYEGANVYLSYGPNDHKLRQWAETMLSTFPGVSIITHERLPKTNQKCQQCHKHINVCPHCEARLHGTLEKGVDTKLAVDMIAMAWDDIYDTAVIVSNDSDFIPAVKLLNARGKKIIHAGFFHHQGTELQQTCWSTIALQHHKDSIRRPDETPSK